MPNRLIAYYLPGYHPIPENDAWWGTGFTEWTNVKKARPLFPSHYQPHVPADLGYYDLRESSVRQAQADLAMEYGIYGFCYYHYWFNGKQLLEYPFNEVLASGKPQLPFCLCWANENWTRTWDGRNSKLLIGQNYSEEDDRNHMRWLVNAFRDGRYIRVNGKPLFAVYQASQLPDPRRTTEIWRTEAKRAGVGEIFLCKVESFRDDRRPPGEIGFDAAIEFQPDTRKLLTPMEKVYWRIARRLNLRQGCLAVEYTQFMRRALRRPQPAYTRFPCVTPSWDNTARRRSGAFLLKGATPEHYGEWLTQIVHHSSLGPNEGLVFINAWNEWAEGNHLEPCDKWGRGFLEATRRAVNRS